jgi:hypothetical protein
MLALILVASAAATLRAALQLVSLWQLLPRTNRDFGLE